MRLAEFVAAHEGQFLTWDVRYGPQCVALAEFYARDVLGIPPVWANAVDWYGKDAAYLTWTRNVWGDRNSKPPAGAFVVWGANARAGTGIYGHLAVCTDPGDGLTFEAFSQNYPTGSPCRRRRFAYDGVIGWGDRPAPPPPPPPPDPCAQVKADLATAYADLNHERDLVAAIKTWLGGAPAL